MYFDTASPPTHEIFQGIASPTCNPGTLAKDTTYYWQVVAHSGLGPARVPSGSSPRRRRAGRRVQCRHRKPRQPAKRRLHLHQHRRLGQRRRGPLPLSLGPESDRTLTGSEAVWSGGTLPLTATAPGRWYLHLRAKTAEKSPAARSIWAPPRPEPADSRPQAGLRSGDLERVAWARSGAARFTSSATTTPISARPSSIAARSRAPVRFTGLTAGATYYYHVKGEDGPPGQRFYEGGWSNPQQVTPDVPPTSTISCPADGALYNPAAWPDNMPALPRTRCRRRPGPGQIERLSTPPTGMGRASISRTNIT